MDAHATTLSSGVLAVMALGSQAFALIAVLGYVAVQSPATTDWTKAVIPVVVIVGAMGISKSIPPGHGRTPSRPERLLLSAYECR
jgi:hypothetical protein